MRLGENDLTILSGVQFFGARMNFTAHDGVD